MLKYNHKGKKLVMLNLQEYKSPYNLMHDIILEIKQRKYKLDISLLIEICAHQLTEYKYDICDQVIKRIDKLSKKK